MKIGWKNISKNMKDRKKHLCPIGNILWIKQKLFYLKFMRMSIKNKCKIYLKSRKELNHSITFEWLTQISQNRMILIPWSTSQVLWVSNKEMKFVLMSFTNSIKIICWPTVDIHCNNKFLRIPFRSKKGLIKW